MDLINPEPQAWPQPTAGTADADPGDGGDAAVVAAIVAGDETAFLSMIQRWSPVLTALANRMTSGPPPTNALLTGAWTRALDAFRAYRHPPGLRVLLVTALLDEARAAGVLVAPAAAYQRLGVGPTVDRARFLAADDRHWPGHWARPPEPWPDITTALEAESAPALASALADLPEPQRVVVAIRDCAGCDVHEIARIIGVSPGQACNLLHRGRAALRLALQDRLAAAS